MRAVTFESNDKPLCLRELSRPEPGPGQVLLKVKACGICGSDLHAYQTAMSPPGTVFGHEFSGQVAAVGEGAEGDWQIGDRAIAVGAMFCGECSACIGGQPEQCLNMELIGFSRDGAYADYVVTQASGTVRLPESVDFRQGALVEPLTVGLAAFRDCQLPLGGNVLVIGAGVIGIAVAKWARHFGAEHVAISDLNQERLSRAGVAGATTLIDAGVDNDPVDAFKKATGTTPDVIVECVGKPMLQRLIEVAPYGCHIVSVGAAMEQESILSVAAAQKRLRMTFSFGFSLQDFEFVARMLASDRVSSDSLVTGVISLEEVPDMFEELMHPNAHCKVIIEP